MNFLDILSKAIASEPIGDNGRTAVYRLPGDEFSEYLLRAKTVKFIDDCAPYDAQERKKSLTAALLSTTSLTPLNFSCPHRFSQPLLQSSEKVQGKYSIVFEIVHRAPGQSLSQIKKEMDNTRAYQKMLAELPDETYKEILQKMLWLTDHNVPIDGIDSNIFLDNSSKLPKLNLIDTVEKLGETQEERAKKILKGNKLLSICFYYDANEETQNRLEGIAKEIGFPIGIDEIRFRRKQIPPVNANLVRIKGEAGQEVSLSADSWVVKQRLQQIEAANGITQNSR